MMDVEIDRPDNVDIVIRKAVSGDKAVLQPMVYDFFDYPEYDTNQQDLDIHLDQVLASDRGAIFIAEEARDGHVQEAVGFVTASLGVGLEFGIVAEIDVLYVKPGVRGKQIGSRLMLAIMEWCQNAGADEVSLIIAQQGEPARRLERLYLRLGFTGSRRRLMYRPLKVGHSA